MNYNDFNEEQKIAFKEVCDKLAEENAISENGKKRRKIKLSRKDIMLALFMKNETELAQGLNSTTQEDLEKILVAIYANNNIDKIEELKAKREEHKKQINEISKEINALKLKKKTTNIVIE